MQRGPALAEPADHQAREEPGQEALRPPGTPYRGPLLAIANREEDIARMSELDLDEFQDRPAVVLHEMHCLGQQIRGFCQGQGIRRRIVCYTTQLSTVQSLVALGLGISLVPRMCAAIDRSSHCVYRPLSGATPSREIVVAWRRGRARSWLAERFLDEVRKEGERLSGIEDAEIYDDAYHLNHSNPTQETDHG